MQQAATADGVAAPHRRGAVCLCAHQVPGCSSVSLSPRTASNTAGVMSRPSFGVVLSPLPQHLLRVSRRFNTKQQPSAEWAAFGAFLFLLPQLEVVEGEGALLIGLNVAWDAR